MKDLHLAEACPPPHLSHFGLVVLLLLLFLFILAGMVFAEAGESTAWGRVGGLLGEAVVSQTYLDVTLLSNTKKSAENV